MTEEIKDLQDAVDNVHNALKEDVLFQTKLTEGMKLSTDQLELIKNLKQKIDELYDEINKMDIARIPDNLKKNYVDLKLHVFGLMAELFDVYADGKLDNEYLCGCDPSLVDANMKTINVEVNEHGQVALFPGKQNLPTRNGDDTLPPQPRDSRVLGNVDVDGSNQDPEKNNIQMGDMGDASYYDDFKKQILEGKSTGSNSSVSPNPSPLTPSDDIQIPKPSGEIPQGSHMIITNGGETPQYESILGPEEVPGPAPTGPKDDPLQPAPTSPSSEGADNPSGILPGELQTSPEFMPTAQGLEYSELKLQETENLTFPENAVYYSTLFMDRNIREKVLFQLYLWNYQMDEIRTDGTKLYISAHRIQEYGQKVSNEQDEKNSNYVIFEMPYQSIIGPENNTLPPKFTLPTSKAVDNPSGILPGELQTSPEFMPTAQGLEYPELKLQKTENLTFPENAKYYSTLFMDRNIREKVLFQLYLWNYQMDEIRTDGTKLYISAHRIQEYGQKVSNEQDEKNSNYVIFEMPFPELSLPNNPLLTIDEMKPVLESGSIFYNSVLRKDKEIDSILKLEIARVLRHQYGSTYQQIGMSLSLRPYMKDGVHTGQQLFVTAGKKMFRIYYEQYQVKKIHDAYPLSIDSGLFKIIKRDFMRQNPTMTPEECDKLISMACNQEINQTMKYCTADKNMVYFCFGEFGLFKYPNPTSPNLKKSGGNY